jgi:hypothetical protein
LRTKITVSNLPTDATAKDVATLFLPMFDVRSVMVGQGSAAFEVDRHDAEMLELEFDRLAWRGRRIRVRSE